MPGEILHVESRRLARVKRVQTVQHLFAAFALITTGWAHLQLSHGSSVLPILEVAAGAILVGAAAREKVLKRHDRVGWVEIAGGLMGLVEAFSRLQERHHLSFYIVSFIGPLIVLLMGTFEVRLNHYRLEATDERLTIKLRRFWRKHVDWQGVTSYRVDGTLFTLACEDGSLRAVDLGDVKDRDTAVAWTQAQLARRGISAARELPGREGHAEQREAHQ